jgi:hypothetical protein
LGIGRAGGKSESEGTLLAARLTEMRRERDSRAKETKLSVAMPVQKKKPELQIATASNDELRRTSTNNPKRKKNKKSNK